MKSISYYNLFRVYNDLIETIVTLYSSKCYTAPCYYYIYILVSFFQLEKAEEIHQQLLKAKKDLESDKEI